MHYAQPGQHRGKLWKNWVSWVVVAVVAGLVAGCSPFTVINELGSNQGIAQIETREYGTLARQRLDVYRALHPNGKVVVFVYGGGWTAGERGDYRFVAQTLAERGVTVVIPDYRLHPDVRFPAFVEDAAAAVGWTFRHLAAWGSSPDQVYLVGHSAGAHIVSLLALDAHYLRAHGVEPARLAGVVGLSTPADFAATLGARYRPIFTDDAGLAAAQPIRYVNAKAPPLLLLHGADDTLVYPENSKNLAEKQRAAGGKVTLEIYPDMGHIGTVTPFIEWFGRPGVLARILDFLGLAPPVSAPTAAR